MEQFASAHRESSPPRKLQNNSNNRQDARESGEKSATLPRNCERPLPYTARQTVYAGRQSSLPHREHHPTETRMTREGDWRRRKFRRPVLGALNRLRSEGNEGATMPAISLRGPLGPRRSPHLPDHTFPYSRCVWHRRYQPMPPPWRGLVTDASGAKVTGANRGPGAERRSGRLYCFRC